MVDPRPISLTQIDEVDYHSDLEPQKFVVVGPIPGGGGGGGGGDVNSVNGKTGNVVLIPSDIGAAANSDVAEFAANVQTSLTNLDNDLDTKAATTYVNDQLATKASATDLDNVFGIATNAQTLATDAVPKTRTVAGKPLTANISLDKIDVGLSNVDNTSDSAKPVSTAQQAALDAKVPTSRTVAGKALTSNITLAKADVGLGNVDNTSDSAKPVSTAQQTALDGKVPTTRTVAGKALSGDVTLAKADVGLGNVDNTSDANKPVSTATQTALNNKVGRTGLAGISSIDGVYANFASLPATGTAGVLYIYRAG